MSAVVLSPLQKFMDDSEDGIIMEGIEFSPNSIHDSKITEDSSIPSLLNECEMEEETNGETSSPNNSQQHGGLINLGNTCYLNSAVQMLVTSERFMAALESQLPIEKDAAKLKLRDELLNLSHGLKNGDTVHPADFKEAVDSISSLFMGYSQQDSHEFLTTILELLDDLYKKEENTDISETTVEMDETKKSEEAMEGLSNLKKLCFEEISTLLHGHSDKKEDSNPEINKPNDEPQCKLIGGRAVISHDSTQTLVKKEEVGDDTDESSSYLLELNHTKEQHDRQDDGILSSPVHNHFATEVRSRLTCDSCKYTRSHTEKYFHLSIDIGTESGSVEDGLRTFFSPVQLNIKCEKCFCETATQSTEITRLPHALLLHFKRFIVDYNPDHCSITYRKNQSAVNFPERLSTGIHDVLYEFLAEDVTIPEQSQDLMEEDSENFTVDYQIKSVVNHIGSSASCGHYTADAYRNYNGENKWNRFNDSSVSSITQSEAICDSTCKTAYVVMYEIEERV